MAVTPYRWGGEIDPTFPNITGGQSETWSDVDLTSNGKMVVVGDYSRDTRVYRRNADGSPDTSFSGDGMAEFNFGPDEVLSQVLALPDGSTLLAGYGRNIPNIGVATAAVIARLDPTGNLDPAFGGGDGVGIFNFSSTDRWGWVPAMALQSDGRILVLARSGLVARLNPDGSPDTSFGASAVLETFDLSAGWVSWDLCIQADDSFLVGGMWPLPGNVGSVGRVARFLRDGTPDPSFGTGGVLDIDLAPGTWDEVSSMKLRSDGRILVALAADYVENSNSMERAELRQLLPNGSPDSSFGVAGVVDITPHTYEAFDLQFDSAGRIIGSGSRGTFRLTPTGQDDPGYGVAGHDVAAGVGYQFAVAGNDDVVGIGSPSGYPRVRRILGEARGDGPVFLDAQTSTMHVTGSPVADQLAITTAGGNVQVTFNGATTEFPLSPGLSLNIDTRFGIDSILYDVGDAFAGVTNTIDAGPINYNSQTQDGRNIIDVRSGPIDGSLVLKRDAAVYNYFSDITVSPDATLDLTCSEGVILIGTSGNDEFDIGTTLSLGVGSIIRGSVRRIEAGAGDDLIRGGTGTTVIGGAGDDTVVLTGSGSASLDGGEGNDHLRVLRTEPASDATGTLTESRLQIAGLTGYYTPTTERVSFWGSSSAETLNVQGIFQDTVAEISLLGGNDRLMLGSLSYNTQGSLRKIQGIVVANMGAGEDTVNFNDLLSARPARAQLSDSGIEDLDGQLFGSPSADVSWAGVETLFGTFSPLADDVTLTMSAPMRFVLTGGNPISPPGTGDRLRISDPDAAAALIDLLGPANGVIRRNGAQPIEFSGFERFPSVFGNPDIPAVWFDPEGPHLLVSFGPDVAASIGVEDLNVRDLRTGATIVIPSSAAIYDPSTRRLQVRFAGADGDYRLWINNQGIIDPSTGQQLLGDGVLEFYILAADANRDRSVNVDDFATLAANFGQSGRAFSQGNFNYSPDGAVDLDDFTILAGQFGKTLPPAAGRPKPPAELGIPRVARVAFADDFSFISRDSSVPSKILNSDGENGFPIVPV